MPESNQPGGTSGGNAQQGQGGSQAQGQAQDQHGNQRNQGQGQNQQNNQASYEDWLAQQDEGVKTLLDGRIKGLKSALASERAEKGDLVRQPW